MDLRGAALLGDSTTQVYDPNSGTWVSREFQQIAEIINDYDPTLFLVYIPEADRTVTDVKPFAVVHAQADGMHYPFMFLDESQINVTLLADVMAARDGDPNGRLDRMEAAKELVEKKKWLDSLEEANELAHWFLKTPLHTVKHAGKVHQL